MLTQNRNRAEALISVILPVYNGASTIADAISSIQQQSDPHWELILVDDGSTDDTYARVAAMADADSRLRLIQTAHGGIVSALRTGISEARGGFLARMDADDISLAHRFTAQRQWFAAHPAGGLCGTGVVMTGSDIRAGRQRYEDWLNGIQAHCVVEQELFVECPMAHPTFMMTRSAYDAVGGYRDFSGPEDYDLVFRMWHAGYELGNVPDACLHWQESSGRLSMNSPRYAERAFRQLKRTWLRRLRTDDSRHLYQWGAGEVGKRWLREWNEGEVTAVVDIRPGKIGQQIHGVPVIAATALPGPEDCFVVVMVGTPGARTLIRAWLGEAGYVECRDFRFFA